MPISSLSYPQLRLSAPAPAANNFRFRSISAYQMHKGAAFHGVPARDRVIEFGKHKGKMLGALPSSYLKWVSQNLRARDFEEWARLADEVLQDTVYRDRIEWEAAERVLAGGGAGRRWSEAPVEELSEVSERFGWDNEDKDGWARVNFELLGTSKGGRIPRIPGLSNSEKVGILRPKRGERTELRGGQRGLSSSASDFKRNSASPAKNSAASIVQGLGSPVTERRSNGTVNESTVIARKVTSLSKESDRNGRKAQPWSNDGFINYRNAGSSSNENIENARKVGSLSNDNIVNTRKVESLINDRMENARKLKPLSTDRIVNAKKVGILSNDSIENVRKVGFLSKGMQFRVGLISDDDDALMRGNREVRREMRRVKKEQQLEMMRKQFSSAEGYTIGSGSEEKRKECSEEEFVNPFPGRAAMLNKIKRRQ